MGITGDASPRVLTQNSWIAIRRVKLIWLHCCDVLSLLQTPNFFSLKNHKVWKTSKNEWKIQNVRQLFHEIWRPNGKAFSLFQNTVRTNHLGRCETQHCDVSGLADRSLLITIPFQQTSQRYSHAAPKTTWVWFSPLVRRVWPGQLTEGTEKSTKFLFWVIVLLLSVWVCFCVQVRTEQSGWRLRVSRGVRTPLQSTPTNTYTKTRAH